MNRNGNLSQCPHFIEYKTFVVKDFGFFVNLNGIFLTKTDSTSLFFFVRLRLISTGASCKKSRSGKSRQCVSRGAYSPKEGVLRVVKSVFNYR